MDMQNKVLASVAGNPITEADLEMALAAMGQRGQAYNNPQGRAVLLEQLIAQKLFLMDAQKNLMEREPEFKEQLKQVKEEMLTNYAIKKAVERVKVTDDEIQKFYDENPDQFEAGMTYNASHILVDSEEKAAEIAAQINAGDISFEDAAKANSTCPSGQQGGELGDFGHGQMVPEFEAACDALEAGEMSAPVQTQFGWHLVKLNKKEDGGKMELAEVKEQIRQALMQQKQQAAYQSRVNQLKILFPVDKNNTL
ncbi:MAG: peptidyl-prolyl cis-trans isomerase [Clostridia bacterium]|nr:peptidyl-prolyl cis-trans isomerase [Clostridia bacterium]